jgi:uncharacterized protein (DUF2384 family)
VDEEVVRYALAPTELHTSCSLMPTRTYVSIGAASKQSARDGRNVERVARLHEHARRGAGPTTFQGQSSNDWLERR